MGESILTWPYRGPPKYKVGNTPTHRPVAILILISMLVSGCNVGSGGGSPTATPHSSPTGGVSPTAGATTTSPPQGSAITPPEPGANATGPTASPGASRPPVMGTSGGWNKLEPGGDTTCARGTPYAFWARPGSANKLLVFFEGGGGCWSAETCKPGSTFFDDVVNEGDDPATRDGIFALGNPENPFKDYSMVFVPVCTGDVHWGNNTKVYKDADGTEVTIQHKGFVNATAALDWAYRKFTKPDSIFVAGCSAGSPASILFAPYIIRHYNKSKVTQLGDSLAFVFDHQLDLDSEWLAHRNFPPWIPALAAQTPGHFMMAGFYKGIAGFYPDHVFSQYTSEHDAVQQRYFRANARTASPPSFESALDASLSEIHAGAPNFRSYVAPGSGHCITPLSDFYTLQVNSVRFRDWAAALADGKPVEDVHCATC